MPNTMSSCEPSSPRIVTDVSSGQYLVELVRDEAAYSIRPLPSLITQRLLPVVVPPAPRLVGIEPNPGPRPGKGKKKAIVVVAAAAVPKARKRRARTRAGGGNALGMLVRSASNPFQYSPPSLGFGTFGPTGRNVIWTRQIGSFGNANFAVILDPTSLLQGAAGGGTYGGAVQGSFMSIVTGNSPADKLNQTSGNNTQYFAPTNAAIVTATSETFRPITACVRVTIRYPATSAPGRLYALNICDSASSIAAKSYNDLVSLDLAHPIAFDASGVAILQSNYRQSYGSDFNFTSVGSGYPSSSITTKCMVVGVGWPSTITIDAEPIAHIETLAGDAGGAVDADDATTVALTNSIEQTSAALRRLPTALDRVSLQACQLLQLRTAMSAYRGRRHAHGAPSVPSSVQESDYVDATSTAGEFVSGMGQSVRDAMPSAYTVGGALGTAMFGLAARHAHRGALMAG